MGVPLEIERATPESAPEKHPGSSCHNRQRNRFLPIHGVILTHEQEEATSTSLRLHHHTASTTGGANRMVEPCVLPVNLRPCCSTTGSFTPFLSQWTRSNGYCFLRVNPDPGTKPPWLVNKNTLLADEVHRYLHDEPVQAGPPSWRYKARKFVRRHRRGVVVGAVAATLILLAIGFGAYTLHLQSEAAAR